MDEGHLFCPIVSGEVLAGYRGRLAGLNGLSTPKAVARLMVNALEPRGWKNQALDFIDAAAALNGCTSEDLIQLHSCQPIYTSVGEKPFFAQRKERSLSAVRSMALYDPGKRVRACSQCVRGDLEARRFAVWRRSHQIPGQFACPIHRRALWCIPEQELLPAGPQHSPEHIYPFSRETHDALMANAHVSRAIDLLDTVLRERLVLDREPSSGALRAALLGSDSLGSASVTRLSAAVEEALTPVWLRFAMPRMATEEATVHLVKRTLHAGLTTVSYTGVAILAAIAFPDARSALREMGAKARTPIQYTDSGS